ncbi:MAG: 50S ribosomal protein L15 [Patescibacteria group bacterium]
MELHQLRPTHKRKKTKRIGRGGVHGFNCGRGAKGQNSRAGKKFKPIIRELIKRYPKLRGYRSKKINDKPAVLNLEILDKKFESGDKISPKVLIEKRIIRRINGRVPKVKILSKGELKKALIFENISVSKIAKEKIEKAGGEIK